MATSTQRSTQASLAAHERWARLPRGARASATQAARDAQRARYLERAAELHPGASREVIEDAAHHLYLADQKRRALKSVKARARKAAS